jgi:hypothetical protein
MIEILIFVGFIIGIIAIVTAIEIIAEWIEDLYYKYRYGKTWAQLLMDSLEDRSLLYKKIIELILYVNNINEAKFEEIGIFDSPLDVVDRLNDIIDFINNKYQI